MSIRKAVGLTIVGMFLFTGITSTVLITSNPAQAGIWTSISGAFADTVESKMFAVEAQGNNIRGYIFENPANPGKFCIASASSNGSGLSCDWSK